MREVLGVKGLGKKKKKENSWTWTTVFDCEEEGGGEGRRGYMEGNGDRKNNNKLNNIKISK